MASQLPVEIKMASQLGEVVTVIERLRTDRELLSRIRGREPAFLIPVREALVNAVTHGNRHDISRKVYVQYACESDDSIDLDSK